MANGHFRKNQPLGYPKIYQRFTRYPLVNRFSGPATVTTFSKAEFLGYLLSCIVKIIPITISALCPNFISKWFSWCPTSSSKLEDAEKDLLSNLKQPYHTEFINIGKGFDKGDSFVRTVSLNVDSRQVPIVLLHGFGSGIGGWVMNMDSLSASRPVYSMDILGFGRSSRPAFSTDASEAEMQFFLSIEKWRESVGLERFILLGHSMGGYIAASYAIHYPSSVALLILVDPWGIQEKPISLPHCYEVDSWVKFCDSFLGSFNFLAAIRVAGPFGPHLIRHFRSDLVKRYLHFLTKPKSITEYVYHCNVQVPSGEAAFKALTDRYGWPINPMMHRLNNLDPRVPITFVYGSRSWVNRQPGLQIKYSRLNSLVDVQVIEGAGHHVYADKPEEFNSLINRICESIEVNR